ncbi:MAG: phosphate ABC transporter ATP-binding protein [Deltaproteobacteria bacterium]|nr:MAG: phosphate ABC transporter ATP-binding protein [Deltaproteobacteria bacterium]
MNSPFDPFDEDAGTRAPEISDPVIEISRLSLWYGSYQALFDVSLNLERGSVTALVGPSGCGKTSLIRTINRMNDLYENVRIEGEVRLDGEPVYGERSDPMAVRRRCGMVFQAPTPFPKSIFENVVFGLRIAGEKRREVLEARCEEALRAAALYDEVADRLDDDALELSLGQQQRLCIARAIATHPEVLLMDEPCSALDPISTARVEERITDLKGTYTTLLVTHNLQQAARVSDYCVFMLGGEIVEYAPTEVFFTSPKDPRTEDYLTGRFG